MIDIITMLVTFAIVAFFNARIGRRMREEAMKLNALHGAKIKPGTTDALEVRDIDELKVERHHDQYYFFQEKTDKFMGQGASLDQAARHFTSLRGADILGYFSLDNQKYCFINNECLPFERISQS